jgi:hypothetical protein
MSDQEKKMDDQAETEGVNALPLAATPDMGVPSSRCLGSAEDVESEEPQPTYVPAAVAMGIMMLLWGILTNWIMSAAGGLVMVWAIAEWVREMHET